MYSIHSPFNDVFQTRQGYYQSSFRHHVIRKALASNEQWRMYIKGWELSVETSSQHSMLTSFISL